MNTNKYTPETDIAIPERRFPPQTTPEICTLCIHEQSIPCACKCHTPQTTPENKTELESLLELGATVATDEDLRGTQTDRRIESDTLAVETERAYLKGFRDGQEASKAPQTTPEICNDDCTYFDGLCTRHGTGEAPQTTSDTEWTPRNKTHGLSKGKFYRTYYGLRSRCLSKKAPNYAKYGGRGIGVEWKSFDEFHSDMYASFKEHVATYGEKNTTIDRIDSTKNYSKENCRWATYEVQNNNRSYNRRVTINGKNQTVAEWCREMGLSRNTVDIRLSHYGWDIIRALTTPVS